MIYNNVNQVLGNNFKVIIIGSGPAGISSALKFEEKKIKTINFRSWF
jgi:thioredoxin reductase